MVALPLADAIQGLLDLSGENPKTIVNPEVEVLNSEGEPEVVKPCKRKRKSEDSEEEEDDETLSDSSEDDEDGDGA